MFQVGDSFSLKINDKVVEGTIIDFDIYGDKIVFKISFPYGEVDIDQDQLAEKLKSRR